MFGINVDPCNPAGRPDPELLRSIGFSWVRMVVRSGIEDYHAACRTANLQTILVIARESVEQAFVGHYVKMLKPSVWQVGNEPDQEGPSSWTMTPEQYSILWREVLPILRPQGVPIISAGMASGQPSWLIVDGLPDCHAIAVHPYAKTAEQARSLLRQYRELSGKPIWVTEWHRPVGEIPEFMRMLSEETDMACWFCWSDGMVPGFGLVDVDGKPHPQLNIMKEAIMCELERKVDEIGNNVNSLASVVRMVADQNAIIRVALKLILQGRWTGEMPHAEAFVKALDPQDTEWSASPFPSNRPS